MALGWLAAASLSAVAVLAQPADDCIDSEPQVVRAGGTNGVTSVFAVDLDVAAGNGVDIVAASANDDTIRWYQNDGTSSSFTEHVITRNADGASSVHGADLDNDGDIDLASASADDDTIRWYENIGGTPALFIERVITTTARNATSVFVDDIDGDGDNDIAAASSADDTIALYENDLITDDGPNPAPPGFNEVIVADFANGAAAVHAANVHRPTVGDVRLELLSAASTDDRIAWYERIVVEADEEEEEDVVIWIERVIDSAADGANSVFAADLDGDPFVDVLSASGNDNRISWYRNDGADPPQFAKQIISNQALDASAVFAVDMDGDKDMDALSASRADGKIAWYENLGGGDFGDPTANQRIVTADAPGATTVWAVDLDGDPGGAFDIVAGSSVAGVVAADDKIAWHRNDGAQPPQFTENPVSGGAVGPEALLAVDVDGVNGTDIVATSAVDHTLLWFSSDGAEPPSFTENLISHDAPHARDLFWADLDGDLDPDLVAALGDDDSIAWYENLGGGDFGDPQTNRRNIAQLTATDAASVFVFDLDGDTLPDVLSASTADDKIAWYKNLGGGAFGNPLTNQRIISTAADGAEAVAAVDLDADGDIDVLSASRHDDSIRWFESDFADRGSVGPPAFQTRRITASADEAVDVLALDLDQDAAGRIDVVSASAGDSRILWLEPIDDTEAPQVAELEPGETATCSATYVVTQADADAGSISSTATATGSEVLGASRSDSDTLTIVLGQAAALEVGKFSNATSGTGLDSVITYTYTVTNIGTVALTGVGLTDTQAGLSAIDCAGMTTPPQIALLDVGAAIACTATYTVTEADVDAGSITNTVTAGNAVASDTDTLTIVLGASGKIHVAQSSNATAATGADDEIVFTFTVANIGEDTLRDVSVTASLAGLSGIDCGELAFVLHEITANAFRVADITAADVDVDGDMDIVSASSGDDTIAWYQSDLLDEDPVTRPPAFTERIVSTAAKSARAVAVADVGRSPGGFDAPDIVAGFLFGIEWHEGQVDEVCGGFDATLDGEMDGEELALVGAAFGDSCVDPDDPTEWWIDHGGNGIDYNDDCRIDGLDLAILTSTGVWGRLTGEPAKGDEIEKACAFTCP